MMIDIPAALSLLQLLEDSIMSAHSHLDDDPESAALELFAAEQHLAELRILLLHQQSGPKRNTHPPDRRQRPHA